MTETAPTSGLPRRRIVITSVLLVIAVIVTGLGLYLQAIRTAPIPLGTPSGELTFTTNRDGDWDIVIVDTDGTQLNLTDEGDGEATHEYFPSWSLDSEIINFLSSVSGEMGPSQVLPDGTDRRDLSIIAAILTLFREGRFDWDAHWSPDGTRLVWASLRDLNLEIYTADADGENITRLTSDPARDWFAAISPDGTQVAFSSDRNNGVEDIYVLTISDGIDSERQLTDHESTDTRPMWSLDGTQIAFITERDGGILEEGTFAIYIMDADGSNQHLLGDDELFEGGAVWSPDGSQVAYVSNRDGQWDIYVMDADGENVRRVTDDEAVDLFPVWRP